MSGLVSGFLKHPCPALSGWCPAKRKSRTCTNRNGVRPCPGRVRLIAFSQGEVSGLSSTLGEDRPDTPAVPLDGTSRNRMEMITMGVPRAKVKRPLEGPIHVKTPYMPGNRAALNGLSTSNRTVAIHIKGDLWELPRRLFLPAVALLAERFKVVEVHTEHKRAVRCDRRCAEAKGDECECSCLYANHGGGMDGWTLVATDTLLQHEVIRARHLVTG